MDPAIRAVAALEDDLRRGMYAFIRAARRPVTRDEAAAEVGISRKLAAFHLDKLVTAGLLRAGYESARKVGRAPKVYEPTDDDITITIPRRQHDVLADILLDAVLTETPGETATEATLRVAATRGEQVGRTEREQGSAKGRLGAERALTLTQEVLARHGFEPARETRTCVRLRNCPFHPMAAKAPELVCGVNHRFVTGVLTGLRATSIEATLAPRSGECCVELNPAGH
ncbi:MAG TPA: transcriptional regulator [Pseudonocardiaceae bacterium]|jgi:predicted ArsR family transcriptional regulator|nr:transcriptional regulator [Pseudonocardiaceae bacterium]